MRVTLLGKRVLTDVIELKISRQNRPELPRWDLTPVTVSLQETEEDREDHAATEAEVRVMQPRAKEASSHRELERAGKSPPPEPLGGRQPADTLTLNFWPPDDKR